MQSTNQDHSQKSTVEEIRARFDADVERFSNLETGQAAQIDAPLHLELLTRAAAGTTPDAGHVLDLGCGAGNYTLKLLRAFEGVGRGGLDEVTLVDLSRPMLDRAVERVGASHPGVRTNAVQSDIREFTFGSERFDVVVAAQCLHHLRAEHEWDHVFEAVYQSLRPGGSFWVCDSVSYASPAVDELMREKWGAYLAGLKDEAYRDTVFAYVEKEDTPRPLSWQLEKLRRVGFVGLDVLHVNNRFASFGGGKR